MMSVRERLLQILAEGGFHSGEVLGMQLGVSRAAVWKHIQALEARGVPCQRVPGRGYRLTAPFEPLTAESLRAGLSATTQPLLAALEIHPELESTNRWLMERVTTLAPGHVCLAERQTAGRGRRGRAWLSPYGRNIYMSLYWRFDAGGATLSALGLAVGVAVVRALRELGAADVGLKWPNDVLWQGRKLAGILLELAAEANGPGHVVVGIGLNVDMTAIDTDAIGQPWADLRQVLGGPVSRNAVVAALLEEILPALVRYQREGFAGFAPQWRALDLYADIEVAVQLPTGTVHGWARGVDGSGALLLETTEGVRRFHSGEVSLRSWPG